MLDGSLLSVLAFSLSTIFGIGAALHLARPNFLRRAYDRLEIPSGFYRATGIIGLLIAVFLAIPQTRIWGVIIAELLTVNAVILILGRGKFVWSLLGIAIMVALVPVVLTSPI